MRARGGSAIESGTPGRGGRRLWTGETQEGIDGSGPFGDPTPARARAGKEALKPLTSVRSPGSVANRREERHEGRGPERDTHRLEEKALKGEAHGRSGAERRRQGWRWTSRWRYPNLGRDTPRGRTPRGTRVLHSGMCRRAGKSRRGSIVRRAGLRTGGTVRGCGDGPLKERRSTRGAPVRRKPAREDRLRENPEGVETPSGSDGAESRPSGVGAVSPERRGTPREGRADAARRRHGSPYASSL